MTTTNNGEQQMSDYTEQQIDHSELLETKYDQIIDLRGSIAAMTLQLNTMKNREEQMLKEVRELRTNQYKAKQNDATAT